MNGESNRNKVIKINQNIKCQKFIKVNKTICNPKY